MSIWQRVSFTHRFSQLPSAFYTLVEPQPLDNTRWVAWNGEFAQQFGLPAAQNDELLAVFSGQSEFEPFRPLAVKYAGHQFG
ncbi:protein adenylyltransferase SelO family protein, partial [Vibrio parahaemolyticus]